MCGSACQGRRCSGCEQIQANEKLHGTPGDDVGRDQDRDGETWAVAQQGLGDSDAEGQTTLSGGIRKEDDDDDV
jgi:hypothetical protein